MTVLLRTAVALLVVAPTVALAGPSTPARAAQPAPAARSGACMELAPDDLDATLLQSYADAADDVFAGKVLDRSTHVGKVKRSGHKKPRTYTHTVRVDKVFRGDLGSGDRVMLLTNDAGAQHGLGPLKVDSTYLFFTTDVETGPGDGIPSPTGGASGGGGKDVATVMAVDCAGTTALPDGLSARLRDQVDQLLAGDSAPSAEPVLSDPAGGASEPPALSRTIAPGIALALLGVLGLVLFSWLGRRRA
ncbi:hypothetical protein [Nocardioides panacisoli]|uniref:hypothetical protein n=1 Tax=Nocardioides panacisoli TaxID=627624 RepID=UPI0031DFEB89